MTRSMVHKITIVTAWSVLAFIAYATLSPIQSRPTLAAPSDFEHLAAFAVIGTLFILAYPRQIILVVLVVLGGAALLEIMQLLTPDRHGRLLDAVVKIAGGALGMVAGRVALNFDQFKRWFQQ